MTNFLFCVYIAILAFAVALHLKTLSLSKWISQLNKRHDRRMLAMRCQALITHDRLVCLAWKPITDKERAAR